MARRGRAHASLGSRVQVLIAFEGDGGVEMKAEAEAEAKAT